MQCNSIFHVELSRGRFLWQWESVSHAVMLVRYVRDYVRLISGANSIVASKKEPTTQQLVIWSEISSTANGVNGGYNSATNTFEFSGLQAIYQYSFSLHPRLCCRSIPRRGPCMGGA